MKIEKKHIIIAIVVAVAVYLLWKRGMFAKVSAGSDLGEGGGSYATDTTSLSYILSHINFTIDERNKINAMAARAKSDESYYQYIASKAYEKGHPFDQQLVLEAIWSLYHPGLDWIAGPDDKTSYGWNLQQKVLAL